jgi:hypothetical protein
MSNVCLAYPSEANLCRFLRIDARALEHEPRLAMRYAALLWNDAGNPTSDFAVAIVLRDLMRELDGNALACPPNLPFILRALEYRQVQIVLDLFSS